MIQYTYTNKQCISIFLCIEGDVCDLSQLGSRGVCVCVVGIGLKVEVQD